MQLSLGLAVLLAGSPPPSIDGFLRDLPGMVSQPTASSQTKVDGVKVVQRSVSSSKSPLELKEHFAQLFNKAGLYLPPEQDTLTPQIGAQVTGLDTENLISYTAILQPAGKGTTVVLALADFGAHKQLATERIGPVYPGAGAITSYDVEAMKAMSYSVDATPAELKTFYRDSFTIAGFKETEPNVYLKGNQKFTVTVSPGISERYVLVQLETIAGLAAPAATPGPPPTPKPAPAAATK